MDLESAPLADDQWNRRNKVRRISKYRTVVVSVIFTVGVLAFIYHSSNSGILIPEVGVTEDTGTGAVAPPIIKQVEAKKTKWSPFCESSPNTLECTYHKYLTGVQGGLDTYPGREFGDVQKCSPPDSSSISEFREHVYQLLFPLSQCGKWKGLELGALHQPANIPPQCNGSRSFVDKWPTSKLREFYPELPPGALVEVSVLDDATTLETIPDASVDYVIASHLLEHVEDPLGVVANWIRVLKPGGRLIMMVPNKCNCFDRQRILTSWEHLAEENGNKDILAKHLDEHHREWVVSHMHRGDRWKEANFIPTPNEYDESMDLLVRGNAFTHGGWHVHTWDAASWTYFVHNIDRHFTEKLGAKWSGIDVKSTFNYGLDLVAVLGKK